MSVSPQLVPLSTAKSWAKRLQRISKSQSPADPWPLSRCQLAIAQMLGFEHWHALNKALSTASADPDSSPHKPESSHGSHMLGFEHWSDLTQKLSAPVEDQFTSGALPLAGDIEFPSTSRGWAQFWIDVDSLKGLSEIKIQSQAEQANFSVRLHGQLFPYAAGPWAKVVSALADMLPSPIVDDFTTATSSTDSHATGVDYSIKSMVDFPSHRGKLHCLPVYPAGWDVSIRVQKTATEPVFLSQLNIHPTVHSALMDVAKRTNSGRAMLFSGSVGTGKTTLMYALVNELARQSPRPRGYILGNDPLEFKVPYCRSIPVVRNVHNDSSIQAWGRATDKAISQAPSVMIIDQIKDAASCAAITRACDEGVRSFSTINASPGTELERLSDYDQSRDWKSCVSGWAHSRLLGLLCQHCSSTIG